MTIYKVYVFDDKLISPINGSVYSRITKQNIIQFGFESIDDLHNQFPDFPLRCKEYENKQKSSSNGNAVSLHYKKLRDEKVEQYNLEPNHCTHCNKVFEYSCRNNKFCSQSCAASYSNTRRLLTEASKIRISDTSRNNHQNKLDKFGYNPDKGKEIKPRIDTNCYICNESIRVISTSKTLPRCKSKECLKTHQQNSGKKSANNRQTRSKDEIALFDLCANHFHNVKHNHIIADGWDADIIIEDHMIAILWNGPWHYRNMRGLKHSLLQVQTRDRIKTKLFESLGWTVIVFEDRHYTPTDAFCSLLEHVAGISPRL